MPMGSSSLFLLLNSVGTLQQHHATLGDRPALTPDQTHWYISGAYSCIAHVGLMSHVLPVAAYTKATVLSSTH